MKKRYLKCLKTVALATMVLLSSTVLAYMYMDVDNAAQIAGLMENQYDDEYTDEDMQDREQEAISEFKKLLTDPVEAVKPWAEFCQTEIDLLEGNEKYADLCDALQEIKHEKNQRTILSKLQPHFNILPDEVRRLLESFSGMFGAYKLSCRIKN